MLSMKPKIYYNKQQPSFLEKKVKALNRIQKMYQVELRSIEERTSSKHVWTIKKQRDEWL